MLFIIEFERSLRAFVDEFEGDVAAIPPESLDLFKKDSLEFQARTLDTLSSTLTKIWQGPSNHEVEVILHSARDLVKAIDIVSDIDSLAFLGSAERERIKKNASTLSKLVDLRQASNLQALRALLAPTCVCLLDETEFELNTLEDLSALSQMIPEMFVAVAGTDYEISDSTSEGAALVRGFSPESYEEIAFDDDGKISSWTIYRGNSIDLVEAMEAVEEPMLTEELVEEPVLTEAQLLLRQRETFARMLQLRSLRKLSNISELVSLFAPNYEAYFDGERLDYGNLTTFFEKDFKSDFQFRFVTEIQNAPWTYEATFSKFNSTTKYLLKATLVFDEDSKILKQYLDCLEYSAPS